MSSYPEDAFPDDWEQIREPQQTKTKYEKKIDPEKFDYLPELIGERFDFDIPQEIVYIAVGHKLLYDKVSYHHSGTHVPDPDNMLGKLSGDCEDHSILLASMYKACGLDVSLAHVKIRRGSHILPEVANPLASVDEACDALRLFYLKMYGGGSTNIAYEEFDGKAWFPVDTAGRKREGWSRYVGDIRRHIDHAVELQGGGDWDWKQLHRRIHV